MTKYHKIISVVFSLVFLILLQEFSVPRPIFRFLLPVFLLFLLVLTAYNKKYLETLQKYNPWTLLRPLLFYTSMFGLFLIIPGNFWRGLFLLLVVALGSIFQIFLGKFAEHVALNETLVIGFGLYMSISAFALLYAPKFQTLYLAAIFAGTFLAVRSFYEVLPQNNSIKMAASAVIALFCTELFWALTFLPLHYSAPALMLFNLFYFCLVLNYYQAFNILNIRKFQLHLGLMMLCSGFIFLLTPWKIIG
jgi:hypothetical protein